MASELRAFPVTVPAGTQQATPYVADVSFPPRVVSRVDILVPTGSAGLVGFRLTSGGSPVIPSNPGGWIVAAGEVITWPLDDQIDSGGWQVTAYNLGQYDHTLYVRFLLDQVGKVATVTPIAPLPVDSISSLVVPALNLSGL